MGGAYIALCAMYATSKDRTHGKERPCVRHPDLRYPFFIVTGACCGLAGQPFEFSAEQ